MNTPILIFDDNCPFCSFLAKYLFKAVGHRVIITARSTFPFQHYPSLDPQKIEGHPHYLTGPHDEIFIDHEAVSHTLSHLPFCGWFRWSVLNPFWKILYWTLKKVRNYMGKKNP
jgi:predicted DCC family thiol-disulfide oxidoreductase YuxK